MFTEIRMYLRMNQGRIVCMLRVIKGLVGGACVHTAEADSSLFRRPRGPLVSRTHDHVLIPDMSDRIFCSLYLV